jgi:hypothetical protein
MVLEEREFDRSFFAAMVQTLGQRLCDTSLGKAMWIATLFGCEPHKLRICPAKALITN